MKTLISIIKNQYNKLFQSNGERDYTYLLIKLFALFLIIYFFITIYNQQQEINSLKVIYEDKSFEYSEKQKELKKVEDELKNIDSKEFIEKQAREKLKMVKPNETVYIDVNKNKNEEI